MKKWQSEFSLLGRKRTWQVTTMTEEDLEKTEGETVDLHDKLLELVGWKTVDNEKVNNLTWFLFDASLLNLVYVFVINVVTLDLETLRYKYKIIGQKRFTGWTSLNRFLTFSQPTTQPRSKHCHWYTFRTMPTFKTGTICLHSQVRKLTKTQTAIRRKFRLWGFLYHSICLLGLLCHYRVSFVLVVKHHFYPPPSFLSLFVLPKRQMLGFSFIVLSSFILIIVLSWHFVPWAFALFYSDANKHTLPPRTLSLLAHSDGCHNFFFCVHTLGYPAYTLLVKWYR